MVVKSEGYKYSAWYSGPPLVVSGERVERVIPYRRHLVGQGMGGVVTRGMKATVHSDGNGNIELGEAGGATSSEGGEGARKGEEVGRLPVRLEMALDQPKVCSLVRLSNAWNPSDRSLNIFVKEEDGLTLHRHPVAQSTDCIRGKVGYSQGLHVMEFTWPHKQRGTHAVVGVGTKEAPLHSPGRVD